jgi:hypothetical protein
MAPLVRSSLRHPEATLTPEPGLIIPFSFKMNICTCIELVYSRRRRQSFNTFR